MFYSDAPITSNEEDRLERDSFVKTFAQALLNQRTEESFSIGLYGEWGSGKTSLVNMLLEELEAQQDKLPIENKIVVFHFAPWNFSDANQLFNQFFVQLSNKFRSTNEQRLIRIGELLDDYAESFEFAALFPVVGEPVAKVGKRFALNLGKKLQNGTREKDIQKQKDAVIEILRQQSQKILVVIDDIDRLNNEQIRLVFQLMASVANFPNTIYLVVFDKDIVVKALEKVQEGSGEDYLEKIIQMPIELPNVQREKIHLIFYDRMDEVIKQTKASSFQRDHWQEIFKYCIDPFIRNIRDVNRLCNSTKFKLFGMGEEVDFADMVAITGLELKLPQIYEWTKNNRPILTGESYGLNRGIYLDQKPTQKDWYEEYYAELNELLNSSGARKEYDVELVLTFLARLFPSFGQKIGKNYTGSDKDTWRRNNQIAHSEKFDRYFDLDLDNIGIKKAEVLKTVNSMDAEDICTYILDCDKRGESYELLEEINAIRSLLPLPRVKVLAQGVLDAMAGLNATKQIMFFTRDPNWFAANLIIELLNLFPSPDRFAFLGEAITNANIVSFSSIAYVINLTELAYGRLTSDGRERDYKKIVSGEELDELEMMFVKQAKSLLQEQNLFDSSDWIRIFLLLERFSPEYIKGYLAEAFRDNNNILKYLPATIGTWYGESIRYEIREGYQKYITEDQILGAIEATKKSGELFSLPSQVQSMSVAFYLNCHENVKFPEGIMQAEVDELLSSWRDEIILNQRKQKEE